MNHGRRKTRRNNDFFDLEASESDAESTDHSRPGSALSSSSGAVEQKQFLQFTRLPIELRRRVWEFFSPDLLARSRVLGFKPAPGKANYDVWEGPLLEEQTAPIRAVFATHMESRLVALKLFPHVLPFRKGRNILHFNKDKDVIFLDLDEHLLNGMSAGFPGFAENIKHLALDHPLVIDDGVRRDDFIRFCLSFPSLKTLYSCIEYIAFQSSRQLRWATTDCVKQYHIIHHEDDHGFEHELQFLYCWPDLDDHLVFVKSNIPIVI